jgi:predicted flap endonuclease-1-like 5' DNA nuclease
MAAHERLSFDRDPPDGESEVRSVDAGWEERAAFRIAIESRLVEEGRLIWRTRAYHEEHDQERVWTGLPDEAIIEWFLERLRQSLGSPVSADTALALPESSAVAAAVAHPSAAPSPETPLPPVAPPSEAALPPAVQPVEPAAEQFHQDDLQQIPGIGPAIARRLHAAGISTFAAVAACTPADLARHTGRSAEQIVRMGWIERARDLALSSRAESQPAPETKEREDMVSEEPSILFAAILLDEEGEVRDAHLTTAGEIPPEWNDQRVARFFMEAVAPADTTSSNIALHIDNPLIELIRAQPGKRNAYRLSANATVRIEGVDTVTAGVSAHLFLLAYNLDSHETHILNTAGVSLAAGATEAPFTLDSDLPEVGHYQLVLAALIPEMRILTAVSGPPLRVTP